MLKLFLVIIFSLCISPTSAKEVIMAFGQDAPPYIFEKAGKGIEIEIISAALAYKGHTLKPLHFPLGRVPVSFRNHIVDAVAADMGTNLEVNGGFYADPAIIYDNVFITLKHKNIVINKPSDLDGLQVLSFQGGGKLYPNWLTKVIKEDRFLDIHNQLSQVKLLHLGRYDVALSDRYIFNYFTNKIKAMNTQKIHEIDEHKFTTINPDNFRPVFSSKKIRDDFNLGLQGIKENGQFQKIYDHYSKF